MSLKEALREMETIHQGQYDNLKIQTETHRVWLSRVDGSITVEQYKDGRWETVERFA